MSFWLSSGWITARAPTMLDRIPQVQSTAARDPRVIDRAPTTAPPGAGAMVMPLGAGVARCQKAEAVGEVGPTGFPETGEGVERESDGGGPGGLQERCHLVIRSSTGRSEGTHPGRTECDPRHQAALPGQDRTSLTCAP